MGNNCCSEDNVNYPGYKDGLNNEYDYTAEHNNQAIYIQKKWRNNKNLKANSSKSKPKIEPYDNKIFEFKKKEGTFKINKTSFNLKELNPDLYYVRNDYLTNINELFSNYKITNYPIYSNEDIIYQGAFNDNEEFENFGRLYDLKSNFYKEGVFKNGDIVEGLYYKDLEFYYFGEIENGKPHGYGQYTDFEKKIYIGNLKNGIYEGSGVLISSDGNIVFNGDFKNGKKEGKGILKNKNIGKYIGNFKHDLMDGEGYLKYNNDNMYIGSFSNNKMNGHGSYIYNNGLLFEGEFRNNLKTGKGKLYKFKDISELSSKNNDITKLLEIKNKLLSSNDFEYLITGTWDNDLLHGEGKMITKLNKKEQIIKFYKGKKIDIRYEDIINNELQYKFKEIDKNKNNKINIAELKKYYNNNPKIETLINKYMNLYGAKKELSYEEFKTFILSIDNNDVKYFVDISSNYNLTADNISFIKTLYNNNKDNNGDLYIDSFINTDIVNNYKNKIIIIETLNKINYNNDNKISKSEYEEFIKDIELGNNIRKKNKLLEFFDLFVIENNLTPVSINGGYHFMQFYNLSHNYKNNENYELFIILLLSMNNYFTRDELISNIKLFTDNDSKLLLLKITSEFNILFNKITQFFIKYGKKPELNLNDLYKNSKINNKNNGYILDTIKYLHKADNSVFLKNVLFKLIEIYNYVLNNFENKLKNINPQNINVIKVIADNCLNKYIINNNEFIKDKISINQLFEYIDHNNKDLLTNYFKLKKIYSNNLDKKILDFDKIVAIITHFINN